MFDTSDDDLFYSTPVVLTLALLIVSSPTDPLLYGYTVIIIAKATNSFFTSNQIIFSSDFIAVC